MNEEIECRDLVLAYREHPVLKGVDLRVPPGLILSLVGPSGCGKTSLLRCIAGLLKPTSGTIKIRSTDPGQLGYVFQEPALLPWRTALENAALPLQLIHRRDRIDRARQLLLDLGLQSTDLHKYPNQLSGGMRMRISLARALVTDPSILLLDEPFAALDDMLRSRLCELVLQLHRQQARTVVLVTHNIAEAIFLGHQVAVMDRGKIGGRIEVELPEPRDESLKGTAAFARLYSQVLDRLREAQR